MPSVMPTAKASIDSPSADVLAQVYSYCKRPGLFNSVSGEGNKLIIKDLHVYVN